MRWRIERHEELSSTIDRARSAIEEGAPEGTVILADCQTAGRGRRGRRWVSPSGGLWLSVVLRPSLFPRQLGRLAIAAAVAAAEAVEEKAGLEVGLKWPNDLQVKGRKLAGILLESRPGRGGRRAVILSLGLNLNLRPEAFPPSL